MANAPFSHVDCDNYLAYIYTMKHISILALSDATISSIDSAYQILNRVNDFLKYQGIPPFYKVEIVGVREIATLNNGLYRINVNQTITNLSKTDMVVIPLLCGDFSKALEKNREYADWMLRQHRRAPRSSASASAPSSWRLPVCSITAAARSIGPQKMNSR